MTRFGRTVAAILTAAALLLPLAVHATGSLFSGLGYGIIENFNSSRAAGMGNAGLALLDPLTLNFANPALLVDLRRTTISVGGYFSRQWMQDHQASDLDDWAQFEYFGISIPLYKTVTLAGLFSPYTRVEFRYGWHGSLDGVPYYESYQGTGGLSRASLALAWAPAPWAKIGAAASAIMGEVEDLRGSYFDATGYLDSEFLTSNQWLGFSGIAGLVLQPHPAYLLAFTFEPEVPMHVDKSFSYTNEDSTSASQADYRLAARYGAGISRRLSATWQMAAQAVYSPWGSLTRVPGGAADYRDSYELSAGAEWIPGNWNAEHFLKRLQYRFGARWETGYVLSAGNPVNALFATAGFSYPFHEGRERFDISFEFSQRGELSANDGQEQTFKLRLGMNLSDTWFQRPKPPWQK